MKTDRLLSEEEAAEAHQRWLEAVKLQEIEGNPLTPDEIEMFEMFHRARWSHERCRAFILANFRKLSAD